MTRPPSELDDLALSDLRRVVLALVSQVRGFQEQVALLEDRVAARDSEIVVLKDEIRRLKGLPPKPKFPEKPSGMDKATTKFVRKAAGKPGRGSKRDKL